MQTRGTDSSPTAQPAGAVGNLRREEVGGRAQRGGRQRPPSPCAGRQGLSRGCQDRGRADGELCHQWPGGPHLHPQHNLTSSKRDSSASLHGAGEPWDPRESLSRKLTLNGIPPPAPTPTLKEILGRDMLNNTTKYNHRNPEYFTNTWHGESNWEIVRVEEAEKHRPNAALSGHAGLRHNRGKTPGAIRRN